MYNPFKPHIIQWHDGNYTIRKWGIFWWKYLCSRTSTYNSWDYGYDHRLHDFHYKEDAYNRLNTAHEKKPLFRRL